MQNKDMQSSDSKFWENLTLDEMSDEQWEALCDGCGKCCLVKLEDEEKLGDIYYTNIACRYLDQNNSRCTDYKNRFKNVPNCTKLKRHLVTEFHWLPTTCAYRLLSENKPLYSWHHLESNSADSVHEANMSVATRVISEVNINAEEIEEYIVSWVN